MINLFSDLFLCKIFVLILGRWDLLLSQRGWVAPFLLYNERMIDGCCEKVDVGMSVLISNQENSFLHPITYIEIHDGDADRWERNAYVSILELKKDAGKEGPDEEGEAGSEEVDKFLY